MKQLAVLVPYFNPFANQQLANNLYRTLAKLRSEWREIILVELIYKTKDLNRQIAKIPPGIKRILYQAESVMFHKEQMLNIAARSLLDDYENIAAFDADIMFETPRWPSYVLAALEDFNIVQCFSTVKARYQDEQRHDCYPSAMYQYLHHNVHNGSPGGAWAGDGRFWSLVGLFDKFILGPNDSFLFDGITGRVRSGARITYKNIPMSEVMHNALVKYTDKMDGMLPFYVPLTARFQYHGSAANKRYSSRLAIMEQFNPDRELTTNKDGLYEWVNPVSTRAKLLRSYFEVKDNPDAAWKTKVECVCVTSTVVNGRRYKAGERITAPLDDINQHFRIVWR